MFLVPNGGIIYPLKFCIKMSNSQNLAALADRLVSLVVRYASAGDWLSAQKYEERLRRCRSLLVQTQTPGF